jgi:hypothetical protein
VSSTLSGWDIDKFRRQSKMKAIDSLKKRLNASMVLSVQNEGGHLSEAGFKWNQPADSEEIQQFEILNGIKLPETYKEFLGISNGATLFKDVKYGQWGCEILGLNELMQMTLESKNRGYHIKDKWIVFATWIGDGDILLFDITKSNENEKNYIIDGDQGYQTDEWDYIKGGFENWIDRLIVAQGAKYWRWA